MENVDFPLVLKHFLPRENGGTTEEQPRNNRGTTEKQPRNNRGTTEITPRRGSLERLFYWFFYYFSILIFEPLLEPLQLKAVREKHGF